jgi:hypothetical protein
MAARGSARSGPSQTDTSHLDLSRKKLQNELHSLAQKQNKLLDTYLAELVSEEVYKAKTAILKRDEVGIKGEIAKLEQESGEGEVTLEQIKNVFYKGNSARKEYLAADDEQKRVLVSELLWNLSIGGRKVQDLQFKSVYSMIAKHPKPGNLDEVLEILDSNRLGLVPKNLIFWFESGTGQFDSLQSLKVKSPVQNAIFLL